MNHTRPLWAWLLFPQLAAIVTASVLAATGHFPVALFQHAPFDKIGHLLAYGGLAFLGAAFVGRRRRSWFISGLLVAATLEEVSQRAFPARTFDLGDLTMNVVGIVGFGVIATLLLAAKERRFGRSA